MSQKAAKMCKSPKNLLLTDKVIEYEHLNTNCTIVGSNNLHLVKKPQTLVTAHSVSPVYSNPSPGPYGSPASMKSPSPQLMKPPTPQPTFPVMQLINPVIATRPMHQPQPANVIKLKPPLNILPKPSSSPQQARQSPKPSPSPQLQVPQQATLMQQPLLLNQMPMLAAPGMRFILQPQTAKISPQVQQVQQTQQGLILQQATGQQLLHLQPPRSQPMVRVLTNGVGLPATTYVTQMAPVQNTNLHHTSSPTPKKKAPAKKKKQRLDLANIMKLSGIGDDDDVMFESDASLSESDPSTTPQPLQVLQTHQQQHQQQMIEKKPITSQPSIIQHLQQQPQTSAPIVQVLNQAFQQGSQQAAQMNHHQSLPFSPFSIAAPNFTIGTNGSLMVQRSGGFKLALGEDGRLVLQHDPTLNQDLQSQLVLQNIFGLNGSCGSLVLQPSIDQQIHSQTVQTIQQQSVQTIQQQTVQSQTIQTVQHQIVQPPTMQSIQSQIQGQIQSLLQQQNISLQQANINNISLQQPNIIQGLITSQAQQQQPHTAGQQIIHNNQVIGQKLAPASAPSNVVTTNVSPTTTSFPSMSTISSVINHNPPLFSNSIHSFTTPTTAAGQQPVLKVQPFQKTQPPVQTVYPIHHHNNHPAPPPPPPPSSQQQPHSGSAPTSYVVNLTPDQLEQLKRNGQLTVNGQTIFMQRPTKDSNSITSEKKTSPKIKPLKKPVSKIAAVIKDQNHVSGTPKSLTTGGNNLDKIINSVAGAGAGIGGKMVKQPAAIIQPSLQVAPAKYKLQSQLPNHAQPAPINQINFQPQQINLQSQKMVTTTSATAAKVMISPTTCTPTVTMTTPGVPLTPIAPIIPSTACVQSIQPTMSIVSSSGVVVRNIPAIPTSSIISVPAAIAPKAIISTQTTSVVTATAMNSIGGVTTSTITTTAAAASNQQKTDSNNSDVERILGHFIEETKPIIKTTKIQKVLQHHPTQPPQVQIQQMQLQPMQNQLLLNQLNPNSQVTTSTSIHQQQQQQVPITTAVVATATKQLQLIQHRPNQNQIVPTVAGKPKMVAVKDQQEVVNQSPTIIAQPQVAPQQQQTPQMIVTSSPLVLPQLQNNSTQRIHTIQLTPQKQQHLKSIQLQIQTLSARMQPGNEEMQNALKVLFQEQQKILASGKLLPPDKVFYHGNQIIVNNLTMAKNEVLSYPIKPAISSVGPQPADTTKHLPKIESPAQSSTTVTPTATTSTATVTTSKSSTSDQTSTNKIPIYKRAQLIEQQMNTDQNGAIKPDIHTPFRDKGDACKRLIRYHCFEQPVLSEKDLDKADEIFELTARHFIDKFGRMVDKYSFLLHKESQRHVQTSELMMLDRMFLSEEQQSIIKLRQEIDECNMEKQMQEQISQQQQPNQMNSEDYDEWACIQRELGCLPENAEGSSISNHHNNQAINRTPSTISSSKKVEPGHSPVVSNCNCTPTTIITTTTSNHHHAIPSTGKRPASSPSISSSDRSESKKLRMEKTFKSSSMSVTNENGVQSAEATRFVLKSSSFNLNGNGSEIGSQQNLQQHEQQQHILQNQAFNNHHHVTSSGSYSIQQQRLNMQQYTTHSSHQIVQHIVQNQMGIQHRQQHQQNYQQQATAHNVNLNVNSYNCSMSTLSSSCSSTSTRSNNEENDSIDEQVQSAIDSILNLQQNNLEMDETMQNMLS